MRAYLQSLHKNCRFLWKFNQPNKFKMCSRISISVVIFAFFIAVVSVRSEEETELRALGFKTVKNLHLLKFT